MKLIKEIFHVQKKVSRFYTYMLSYIFIVAALLIVLGSVVYSSFISALQHEVESSNVTVLSKIRDILDTRMKEMERIAIQVYSNNALTPYTLTMDEGYDKYSAVKELKDYRSTNGFIYDIGLFYNYNNSENIYASTGVYNIDMFFNRIYHYSEWGKDGFLNTVESLRSPVMHKMEPVKLNGFADTNFATYIYPLPINVSKPFGAIIFLIREDTLINMVKNLLKDHNGYLYILDEKYTPVVSISNGDILHRKESLIDYLNVDSISQTVRTLRIGEDQVSVISLTSEYNGWHYIIAMPTQQFMKKVHTSRMIFNYTIAAVFLFGIVLAFFFANNNYRPLGRLVSLLKGHIRGNPSNHFNEIDFISNTIDEVTQENKSLVTKLKSKSAIMKEQLLLTLLNGKNNNNDELESMLDISGISFDKPRFVVLLFLIDEYSRFKKAHTKPIQDLLRMSIVNIIEELSLSIGKGYAMDLSGDRGIVLLLNSDVPLCEESCIHELSAKAKDLFNQNFDFTFTIGVGSGYHDISGVAKSYAEAVEAADQRFVKGKDRVIFYHEVKNRQEKFKHQYPIKQQTQLSMAIKQGKSREAEPIIRSIFESVINQPLSLEAVRYLCFDIINTVLKTLHELNLTENDWLEEKISNLSSFQFETVSALENEVVSLCNTVCEFIVDQKESKNFELRDQMMDYVKKNYTDSNLSLEIIAGKFDFSPSYLSRYFSNQTGYTLMRYIDMLRMDHAKELLRSTNSGLKEILFQVGYIDESNFIKKFKKNEGVTPMQYRSNSTLLEKT